MSGLILPFRGVMPVIHPSAFIAPMATIIGNVTIGPEASIWFGCTLRADMSSIEIGARTNIQDGCVLHVGWGEKGRLVIGPNVLVGHMCLIHSCHIGEGAFIGMSSTIMDTAAVEPFAMLAGGSLLTPGKVVPSGEMWGGRPARKVRDIDLSKVVTDGVDPVQHYAELGREYREMLEQRGD